MKFPKNDILIKGMIQIGYTLWIGYLLQSGKIELYLSPSLV
ncbi:hypothetical protein [Desulfosporosinus sp. FKB]|nr:hypothetical protein [Desulfosporosinus sp. FKB]